jgi:hypothetical protein
VAPIIHPHIAAKEPRKFLSNDGLVASLGKGRHFEIVEIFELGRLDIKNKKDFNFLPDAYNKNNNL